MAAGLKKTLIGLTLIALVLFAAGMQLYDRWFQSWYFSLFPWLVLLFYVVNAGVFILFYRSLRKPHNQFIRTFMGSTGAKLMIYLIVLLVFILNAPKTALAFAVSFAILYIAFTAYDVYIMVGLVKRPKEKAP